MGDLQWIWEGGAKAIEGRDYQHDSESVRAVIRWISVTIVGLFILAVMTAICERSIWLLPFVIITVAVISILV